MVPICFAYIETNNSFIIYVYKIAAIFEMFIHNLCNSLK